MILRTIAVSSLLLVIPAAASAQQGYEFEVYSAEVGPRGSTEIEISTNYVAEGLTDSEEGVFPTQHAYRSSLEVSRTLTTWLQASAYTTANARPGHSLSYVGNRAKLTAIAPTSWKLPFDLGVANELIYSRAGFGEYRWAYELSPIFSRNFGSVEAVFNPSLERGLSGSGEHHIEMEPRGKIGYVFGDDASVAVEYYGGLGGIGEGYSVSQQRHQVFLKGETELASRVEAAFGIGRGLTRSSDKWVISAAMEYRLGK